jgi:glycosyltransferase involved in cell wall biosynthesis
MKVLLISTFEAKSGAAVAAKRLMHALNANGVDAKMLVRDKITSDPLVSSTANSSYKKVFSKFAFLAERLQIFIANKFSRNNLFSVSTASTGFSILNNPLVKEANIIHLHWINQGFLSITEIDKLTKLGKPVIWTMHDMWPITGICHYSRGCNKYLQNCGFCPYLQKPANKDLSYQILQKKKKFIVDAGIHFVACSQWLRKQAEISSLTTGNFITNIPNPIDTLRFTPGDKRAARVALNLPQDKKLLLFGALIASDQRKGLEYLIQATNLLADLSDEVEVVFCGEVKENITLSFGLKAHALGYISDPDLMVKMYQAADCFIIPSLEENLPNMIMEAMACGIPCVGFEIGGIPEMIIHKQTGYISVNKSAEELAIGIRYVLNRSEDTDFRQTNRDFVLGNYSEFAVADRYLQLYSEAINK